MDLKTRINIELAKPANYIPMGFWVKPVMGDTTKPFYHITDLGIPMVKVADGTALGYSVYVLQVDMSNDVVPSISNPQWDLVESADFIYMQQAYIERLQAEIVTAEKINALEIIARRLVTPYEEVGVEDFQSKLATKQSVRIRDRGVNPITYGWETVYLPSGIEYDGLHVNIEAPYGTISRLKIKPASGGIIFTDGPIGSLTQIKLSYTTRARMQLLAAWDSTENVLDWFMTSYSSYRISLVQQTLGRKIPSILAPGDIIMTAVISANGAISNIVSNWKSPIAASWIPGNGYMITLPWPFYFNTSGSPIVAAIPLYKYDVSVALSSGAIKNISHSIMNNTGYERTQIYIGITDMGGTTLLQNEFCITVKAADYIVQDEYLEQNID